MTNFKLSSIFQSVQNSDFPYLHPDKAIVKDNSTRILVTRDIVNQAEAEAFDMFLNALEIDPSEVDINYGMANYVDDVFSGHCPAYFGMYQGKMGLLIGVENRQFETSSIFVPCEASEDEVKHGKRVIKEWVYTLNGTPVKLEERLDNEGKSTGKFYLSINYQNDLDEHNFSFPFLLDKSGGDIIDPLEIRKAFKSGVFHGILKDLGMPSRVWIAANKAFIPAFRDSAFPASGVLILAKNGAIKVTPANSHPNIKSDIVQSQWQIVATSHPELLVQYFGSDKQQQIVSLSDCNFIQFTSAQSNNEGFTWLVNKGIRRYDDFVVIHIVRPSSIKIENTPVNTVTNIAARMKAKLAQYAHLAKLEWTQKVGYVGDTVEEDTDFFVPDPALHTTPAFIPTASQTDVDDFFSGGSEQAEKEAAYDDLFQEYPKLKQF